MIWGRGNTGLLDDYSPDGNLKQDVYYENFIWIVFFL